MTRILRTIVVTAVAMSAASGALSAQTTESSTIPAHDPSARLEKLLPADVWERVRARIADARARELPAEALENRALKFAARGVKAEEIERAIAEHATRLEEAKKALETARAKRPSGDEVEAGAEAMRMGVDGSKVSAFAKDAPRDRSLAVPLHVLGSLAKNGVPVDEALKNVQAQLAARATDSEIEKLPAQASEGRGRKPAVVGRDLAATKRPGAAGPPSGVPANGGSGAAPVRPPVQPPVSRP